MKRFHPGQVQKERLKRAQSLSDFFSLKKGKTNHCLPEVLPNDASLFDSNADNAPMLDFTLEETLKE